MWNIYRFKRLTLFVSVKGKLADESLEFVSWMENSKMNEVLTNKLNYYPKDFFFAHHLMINFISFNSIIVCESTFILSAENNGM